MSSLGYPLQGSDGIREKVQSQHLPNSTQLSPISNSDKRQHPWCPHLKMGKLIFMWPPVSL